MFGFCYVCVVFYFQMLGRAGQSRAGLRLGGQSQGQLYKLFWTFSDILQVVTGFRMLFRCFGRVGRAYGRLYGRTGQAYGRWARQLGWEPIYNFFADRTLVH